MSAAAALLAVALLATAALLVRRRSAAGPMPVALQARQPLGKDSGVAVVSFAGRQLLLGYGAAGVTLVASGRPEEDR